MSTGLAEEASDTESETESNWGSTSIFLGMFYSSAVFLAILAQSANGFNMPKSAQHLTSLRAADPWAPNTATTNTVDLADLK